MCSTDPRRDKVEDLKRVAGACGHPGLVALTGDADGVSWRETLCCLPYVCGMPRDGLQAAQPAGINLGCWRGWWTGQLKTLPVCLQSPRWVEVPGQHVFICAPAADATGR